MSYAEMKGRRRSQQVQYHRRCEASAWLRRRHGLRACRANFSVRNGKRCGMPAELDEATELHSHQKSRRNSRAIVPRTTARTRNNAVNAFCNGARPFCSRATPRAMVRDRFTRLQEGFATLRKSRAEQARLLCRDEVMSPQVMMRGKIARKRQIFAALRAIKTAKWRLFR